VGKNIRGKYEFAGLDGMIINNSKDITFTTIPINSAWPRYKRGVSVLKLYLSNYDIIHTGASGYKTHPLLLRLGEIRGATHIHTHHTTTPGGYEQQRWLATNAETVTAVSPFVANWAQDEFGLSDVTVIPNGVDRHQFRPDLATTDHDHVLFVGRLVDTKHPELIIEIAKRRTDLKFAICGNGPLKDELESDSPPNVEFLGHLSKSALVEEYARASVMLCPYENEGFGMVVIESMSSGTPVVGLDSGNLSSLIKKDQNGCLCDSLNMEEWLTALEYVQMNREPFDPRESTQQYSWDIVASFYEAAYNELV
jgi:glycosyltransferase involved in cell wall biosynthesis